MDQKMKLVLAFTFFPVFTCLTFAQINTGTVIVIYRSQNKVVMAGDSLKLSKSSAGQVVARNEHDCKIAALGNKTIFAGAGFAGYTALSLLDPHPSWDLVGEAHRIYNKLGPSASFDKLTSAWGGAIINHLKDIAASSPESLLRVRSPSGVVVHGFFFSTNISNGLDGYEVQIFYDPKIRFAPLWQKPEPISCATPIGPFCSIGGDDAVFFEFFGLTTKRAREEVDNWRRQQLIPSPVDHDASHTIRLVQLAITYDTSGTVGGNVDAAMLRKYGTVEWVADPDCKPEKKSNPKGHHKLRTHF